MKQYDKAISDINYTLSLDSTTSSPYFERASYYIEIGKYEKAIKDYYTILSIDPEDPEAYYYLSSLYVMLEEQEKAVEMLTISILYKEASPSYRIRNEDLSLDIMLSDLYIKRADIYAKIGSDKWMCADYQKACDLGDCVMFTKYCK